MLFMNEWDIAEAKDRCASHPVLRQATTILYDLMRLANAVSDGWAYWPKPCRAAKHLQELLLRHIQPYRYPDKAPDVTVADLRRACAPIKAFLTREARHVHGHTITIP